MTRQEKVDYLKSMLRCGETLYVTEAEPDRGFGTHYAIAIMHVPDGVNMKCAKYIHAYNMAKNFDCDMLSYASDFAGRCGDIYPVTADIIKIDQCIFREMIETLNSSEEIDVQMYRPYNSVAADYAKCFRKL